MSTFDWVALAFSSFVVALNMVGELKDIELCMAAVHQAGTDLSAPWRWSLLLLNFVRRAVFLPSLVSCIVILVTRKGGDALSVCLNTVAVVFMTDVDNMAYAVGLSEAVRSRVEEAGRVELSAAEWNVIKRTKLVHMVLIVTFILSSVLLVGNIGVGGVGALQLCQTCVCHLDADLTKACNGTVLSFLTFIVGGLIELMDKRRTLEIRNPLAIVSLGLLGVTLVFGLLVFRGH